MFRKNTRKIIIALLFVILIPKEKVLAEVSAPIILNTALIKNNGAWQVSVDGLTEKNNSVLIYINKSFDGLANISNNNSNFYNFSYTSPITETTTPVTVFAINKNSQSNELSPMTQTSVDTVIKNIKKISPNQEQKNLENIKTDNVKKIEKLSAPILISPTGQIENTNPLIAGFAKNAEIVKIYLDGEKISEIILKNNQAEEYTFEYYIEKAVATGSHSVYAITSKNGWQDSDKSNILSFSIINPVIKEVRGVKEVLSPNNASTTVSKETPNSIKNEDGKKEKEKISNFNIILFCVFILSISIWAIAIIREFKKDKNRLKKD